jgi:prophage antirepressor-like protein
MRCRAAIGVIVACGFVAPAALEASEHLVAVQAAHDDVARAARRRSDEIVAIQEELSTPAAEKAAGRLSVRLDRVRAAVAVLSDAEIHELAMRAAELRANPVAGQVDPWVNDVVVVVLIVGIVVLVLNAV